MCERDGVTYVPCSACTSQKSNSGGAGFELQASRCTGWQTRVRGRESACGSFQPLTRNTPTDEGQVGHVPRCGLVTIHSDTRIMSVISVGLAGARKDPTLAETFVPDPGVLRWASCLRASIAALSPMGAVLAGHWVGDYGQGMQEFCLGSGETPTCRNCQTLSHRPP